MIRTILTSCLLISTSMLVFAEAPVVDDSEQFVLSNERQATNTQPVFADQEPISEPAFAKDDNAQSTPSNNAELLNKLQSLEQEIHELRGQIELQSHDLDLLKQEQRNLRNVSEPTTGNNTTGNAPQELTNAHAQQPEPINPEPSTQKNELGLNTTPAANLTNQPTNTLSRGNPADEQISYLAAYELVKKRKLDDALVAMKSFLKQYPKGGYSANAEYWLGELYLARSNIPEAIQHFKQVMQKFPNSSKASASQLKLGYALASWGDTAEAVKELKLVVQRYPDTRVAQLASEKLRTLQVTDAG